VEDRDPVRFDWHDPARHAAARRGIDRVYLVAPPSTVTPLTVVEPFSAEARRAGVRRLILLGSGPAGVVRHESGRRRERHRSRRRCQLTTKVLDLTGRPPRTFADSVRRNRAAWLGRDDEGRHRPTS
jgi:hypothetical protein